MINIALCEDEALYIERIESVIKNNFKVNVLKFENGEDLLNALTENSTFADIFIMDIELSGISGFDAAKKIRHANKKAVIIFLTHYSSYAFDAFELGTFRYIPKVNMEEKLPEAIEAAVKRIEGFSGSRYTVIGNPKKGTVKKVRINDIVSFEKILKYTEFKLADGSTVHDARPIANILTELNDSRFVFAKKGVVINVNHVVGFEDETAALDNGTVQHISRNNIKNVKRKVMENWGKN